MRLSVALNLLLQSPRILTGPRRTMKKPIRTTTVKPTATAPAIYPPARLWRRLAAMVYDSLIVMALIMAYGAAVLAIKYQLLKLPLAVGERAQMNTPELLGAVVVIMGFFSFFWHRGGQTVGMKAWRLQIVQANGDFASWRQGMLRSLLAPLSLLAAGIGYFWCLWDKQGQTLHDKLTGTLTVELPKPVKNKPRPTVS